MATRCNDVDLNRNNFRSDQFQIESSSSTDLHNPPTSQFASLIEKRTTIPVLDHNNNIRIGGGGDVQPLLLLLSTPQKSCCVNHETSTTPSNSMTSSSFSHQTTLTAAEVSRPSLGGLSATISEDDDGFRTPTSEDHRIPEQRPCPPAPRKVVKNNERVMMMSSTTAGNRFTGVKRKINDCSFEEDGDNDFNWCRRWETSSTSCSRRRVLLDLSGEVEAMFPATIRANFGCKIKKARSG